MQTTDQPAYRERVEILKLVAGEPNALLHEPGKNPLASVNAIVDVIDYYQIAKRYHPGYFSQDVMRVLKLRLDLAGRRLAEVLQEDRLVEASISTRERLTELQAELQRELSS